MLPKHPKRVSCVLKQRIQPRESAASTLGFFSLDDATEAHECFALCSLRCHARAQVIVGVQLKVTLQFVGELAIVMRSRHKRRPSLEPRAQTSHEGSSPGVTKRARIAVVFVHSRASFSTCFRPALVSL